MRPVWRTALIAATIWATTCICLAEEAPEDIAARAGLHSVIQEGVHQAERASKPLLVVILSDGCGPCEGLLSATASDSGLRRLLQSFVVRTFTPHASFADDREIHRLGVMGFPTLLFFGPDGGLVDRVDGFPGVDGLRDSLQRVRDGRETIPALRRALEAEPTSIPTLLSLARKLYRSNPDEALGLVARAKRVATDTGDPDSQAACLLVEALVYHRSGQTAEAASRLQALLENHEGTGAAARAATEALPLLMALPPAQATWLLTRGVQLTEHPRQKEYLERTLRMMHLRAVSESVLRSATETEDTAELAHLLSLCLDHGLQLGVTEELAKKLLRVSDRSVHALVQLARYREMRGDFAQALDLLREAQGCTSTPAEEASVARAFAVLRARMAPEVVEEADTGLK